MMNLSYVYVLESQKDFTRYIGYTKDLKLRLIYHNGGKSKYTKTKRPWNLVYYEAYASDSWARKREIQLKKSSWHKRQLFALIFD